LFFFPVTVGLDNDYGELDRAWGRME